MATTQDSARLAERLAQGVTERGAKLAYGQKQSVDGVELVPVALVTYGFGAGESDEADGGGGGGAAIPIGAYIGGADGVHFRSNPIALMAVAIPAVLAFGCAVARVIRAVRS